MGQPGDSIAPARDATFDAGTNACDGGMACARVVFVTSLTYAGSVGFKNAELECNRLASFSRLDRVRATTFVAWLSTAATPVSARFVHGTGRYVDTGGLTVATEWADLTDGTLAASISRDEHGLPVSGNLVWTATKPDGTFEGPDCSSWTVPDGEGAYGTTSAVDGRWTNTSKASCLEPKRFYCFEK